MTLSPDDKYIITSDRDEHVRVSWYPEGYNVETFCLGHTKYGNFLSAKMNSTLKRLSALRFVTSTCLLPFSFPALVSGGGDSDLYVWDYMSGSLRFKIPILEASKPFLVVSGNQLHKEVYAQALANYRAKQALRFERQQKKKLAEQDGSESQAMLVDPHKNDDNKDDDKDDEPPMDPSVGEGSEATPEPHIVHDLTAITTKDGSSVLLWSILGCVFILPAHVSRLLTSLHSVVPRLYTSSKTPTRHA